MAKSNIDVFINCPFDPAYKPLFEAILFTITASAYRVRCALEDANAIDIRFDKLCRLIRDSDRSIHDLSRVSLSEEKLPRFNMPFELGLYYGARQFGSKTQKTKSSLILVGKAYSLPKYLSDLGGNDANNHDDDTTKVIQHVRRYLHVRPDGTQLPGAQRITAEFARFKATLPDLATEMDRTVDELDPFSDYRDYVVLLYEYLKRA